MMILILLIIFSSSFCITPITSSDIVSANQSLRDGETRVSGNFTLGFFTPNQSSPNRYLGIWYSFSPERVVWVANRDSPFNDTSAALRVTDKGSLELSSSAKGTVWSTQIAGSLSGKPVAQLLNTGNLVVRNEDDETNFLWQSFNNLTDVSLTGSLMGPDHFLQSWKTTSDPALGDAVFVLDATGWPQHFIKVKGNITFRSGPWDGVAFAGMGNLRSTLWISFRCYFSVQGFFCASDVVDPSTFSVLQIDNKGTLMRFNYSEGEKTWLLYRVLKTDECDSYAKCGPYGVCEYGTSVSCQCLEGFVPRSSDDWAAGNWTGGCVREKEPVCGGDFNFTKIEGLKLPDARKSWTLKGVSLSECQRLCSSNCNCSGYSILDTATLGCLFWPWELLDTRRYESGQTFYLKSDAAKKSTSSVRRNVGIAIFVAVIVLLGIILIWLLMKWMVKKSRREREFNDDNGGQETDFALFDLETIIKATKNFSSDLKLGDGGFGSVFKGTLDDGQEIAVKRLSEESGQGMTEFKNEASLIAKLQHRNLVKLLGCCIQGGEKMLVYEFMPNKSLNYFIFDSSKRKTLGWYKLVEIIEGIARGLMYLHQDSRLRIIHRDLKASNVLLDSSMTPKISDFGMARLMKEDEQESMTMVVVGTYGYISPEYAIDGVFSTKSDVFSFGVMVLEIISGKKNRGFRHKDHDHNLVGHAWKLWMESKPMELVDEEETAMASFPHFLVLRCIHVGLLCVQHRPDDRPSMSSVLHMLSSDTELPQPKQPGFFAARSLMDSDCSVSNSKTASKSANQLTVTLCGR